MDSTSLSVTSYQEVTDVFQIILIKMSAMGEKEDIFVHNYYNSTLKYCSRKAFSIFTSTDIFICSFW